MNKFVEEILKKYKDLFSDLANKINCPGCAKRIDPPFYNLGKKYKWAEGCKDCVVDEVKDEV